MKSPMQLSLDYLAKLGWSCHIVEKRLPIPGKHITQDCFGFADILAYRPIAERSTQMDGIMLVQTTSWSNFSARRKKILANPHFQGWSKAGGWVLLQAWGNKGLRDEIL